MIFFFGFLETGTETKYKHYNFEQKYHLCLLVQNCKYTRIWKEFSRGKNYLLSTTTTAYFSLRYSEICVLSSIFVLQVCIDAIKNIYPTKVKLWKCRSFGDLLYSSCAVRNIPYSNLHSKRNLHLIPAFNVISCHEKRKNLLLLIFGFLNTNYTVFGVYV